MKGRDGRASALIIIDYIQLMRAEDSRVNRVEQVGQMSRGLKILARELKVPVIALSQLSRAPEQRTGRDKRPILSDLRESGNLEQDADLVAFIYREDYYKNFDEEDVDEEERAKLEGIAELIVRKNRNGPIDTVQLAFLEKYASFRTLARSDFDAPAAPATTRRRWSTRPTRERAGREPAAVVPAGALRRQRLDRASDDEHRARLRVPRARRIAQARTRGVRSVLPAKYQGVGFDRPPISDMARDPGARAGARGGRAGTSTSSARTSPRAAGCGSRATSAPARRRWRCWSPSARSRPGTRSRSTRCRACWRGSAAPTTPTPASSPTSSSSSG